MIWFGGLMSNGMISSRPCGFELVERACLSQFFWLWNVDKRDWCEVDAGADGWVCCWIIVCIRLRKCWFSSCSFRMSEASASARINAGWGMHWKIVARKLCNETRRVSCHCLEKQTPNIWCSSGFLQNGKTESKNWSTNHYKRWTIRWWLTYRTIPSIQLVNAIPVQVW